MARKWRDLYHGLPAERRARIEARVDEALSEMPMTAEQIAREILDRCGMGEDAYSLTAGDVVELANFLREAQTVRDEHCPPRGTKRCAFCQRIDNYYEVARDRPSDGP